MRPKLPPLTPEQSARAAPYVNLARTRAREYIARHPALSTEIQEAADALRAGGFDVHALAGGISAWVQEGRPLDPEGGYVAESGAAAAVLEARRRNT